jgi:hypothetical protein
MALTNYQTLTQALLQAPSSPIPLISTATLNSYINIARNQTAADAECIRDPGFLTTAIGVQGYNFTSIVSGGSLWGVVNVISVRSAKYGATPIDIRGWEWFSQYYLGDGITGTPLRASQQGQGANGTICFSPIPNSVITITLDAVWLPIPLVDDTTIEAIPALWTDAVPFYAAWLGFQSLQRQADAQIMLERYKELIKRGRQMATPSELPDNLPGGAGAQMAAAHGPVTAGVAPASQSGR